MGLNYNLVTISHLFFADDSLIFTGASPEECRFFKAMFHKDMKGSGQLFNLDESSTFLSPSVQNRTKEELKALFQLNVVPHHEKYLGLPSMAGRRKHQFFSMIKTRVLNKIKG